MWIVNYYSNYKLINEMTLNAISGVLNIAFVFR